VFYLTITPLLTVTQVELPRGQFPTMISDSKSLNTSLLEVMISSKNEIDFIRDLSDLTWQIIFNARWASINVASKRPIALNSSRHAPSWPFYLHYRPKQPSSPGIICIVCHQVLRHPSEHGTWSMCKQLLAKAHIAKLNGLTLSQLTELPGSTLDETALPILKRQGSRGILIVSLQRKFTLDV